MSRSTTHGGNASWRGFRRPVRRDRAFWFAIGLSVAVIGLEIGIAAAAGALNWVALALFGALLVIAVFTVVGVVAGTIRGFGEGWRGGRRAESRSPKTSAQANEPEPAGDARPSGPKAPAMPTSLAELTESARTVASSVRKPTSADLDRTARTLGRAIGAARKAARDEK
jgi:hypothetical protein